MVNQPLSSLSEKIYSNISFIDRLLMCDAALRDCSLQEMAEGLLEAIEEDGSVSYLIGEDGRYRTTPLASVIEALYDSDMLPEEALRVMQNRLYDFKDTFIPQSPDDDVIKKNPEDTAAWSVDEGPSVWTTSKAVYTLIKTGFYKTCTKAQLDGLQKAIEWLDNQKYSKNGAYAWGFQHSKLADCMPSIPMTALALKALGIAYEHREEVYKGTKLVDHGYFKTYINGIRFLKENCHKIEGENKCYWEYHGNPSITATVWALEATEAQVHDGRDVNVITQQELEEIRASALKWIIEDKFPMFADGNDEKEPSDPFFEYTKTKYKEKPTMRVFYSFVPYYSAFLMSNGISPFHPKICACIRWLIENKEANWAINDYNSPLPCSFSAAMAINVIVVWLKSINERTYKSFASKMISGTRLEDVCKNCEMYVPEQADLKEEGQKDGSSKPVVHRPVFKRTYAATLILTGVLGIVAIIWIFKNQVSGWLQNETLSAVVGWILLAFAGALVSLMARAIVRIMKKVFKKTDAASDAADEDATRKKRPRSKKAAKNDFDNDHTLNR